ncbi:MAG: HDOD domain-containing protein [Phycisphaeraceae bacterium]|nr:HDOD domain-containing protein [Phycisphaeraceae bacterium]MCW5761796.1 HDOD domain-containing protein [Phycisphaeraceae bacterium]
MSKIRRELAASEVPGLYCEIERRLERIGIRTQPEVAAKILEIVSNADAGASDYARIVSSDPALSGRLLKMSNSAFFAQRQPVTSVDRACVLLGLERLKSLALGFYVSRAASHDASSQLSRLVWTQSIYRACLATVLARKLVPARAAEAFVIGLLLDAGTPLMLELVGNHYLHYLEANPLPPKRFTEEFETLPFTSVDVIAALGRHWKLPDLLLRPLEWQRTNPGNTARSEDIHQLHRIAFYVSAIKLDPENSTPQGAAPLPLIANRLFDLDASELSEMIKRSVREYEATFAVFSDLATQMNDINSLLDQVQGQLVLAIERTIGHTLESPDANVPIEFVLGGRRIELVPEENDAFVVFLCSASGERLTSQFFNRSLMSSQSVLDAFALESSAEDQSAQFESFLSAFAA